MAIITTFEHATLTHADFPITTDFDWLIEQNFAVFQIFRHNRQWQLKIRQYIGVIGLPSGGQLEILPKITQQADIHQTRHWVQAMLTDIWQTLTPKSLQNLANQTPTNPQFNPQLPLSDWLRGQFWQRFARYQPNQQYQRFEHNQTYLQGKLLVKQQLWYNHHQPHKFFHQTENLVFNTAGNRLVKTALQLIGDYSPLSQNWHSVPTVVPSQYQMTFSQAQQELQALPTVTAQQNFEFINFCYSLLSLSQASGQGQNHSQALLINMQFTFEKWVTFQLKQQCINQQPNGETVTIFEQFSQPLTVNHELIIKPDLLIRTEHYIKVIDIKWKNVKDVKDLELADIYQLMTYANQFNADEAWLVVPVLDKHRVKQPIGLIKPNATQFYLVPFFCGR